MRQEFSVVLGIKGGKEYIIRSGKDETILEVRIGFHRVGLKIRNFSDGASKIRDKTVWAECWMSNNLA